MTFVACHKPVTSKYLSGFGGGEEKGATRVPALRAHWKGSGVVAFSISNKLRTKDWKTELHAKRTKKIFGTEDGKPVFD